MKSRSTLAVSLGIATALGGSIALAQQGQSQNPVGSGMMEQQRSQMHDQDGQPVAGYRLMTPEERAEYQEKMQSMDSAEDRQAYREQHRQRMMDRARAQGLEPDAVNGLSGLSANDQRAVDDSESRRSSPGVDAVIGQNPEVGPNINNQRSGDGMPRANPPGGVHQ